MTAPFHIVFAIYPGMTHLDFTGPHQVLSRFPGARITVASRDGGVVEADGLAFAATTSLAGVEACDLLCVPGGFAATKGAADPVFIGHIRRLAKDAHLDPDFAEKFLNFVIREVIRHHEAIAADYSGSNQHTA